MLTCIDLHEREHNSPEFLKLNPMAQLPALVHRGLVVAKAGAICTYLADAYPEAGLAPDPKDPARGTYLGDRLSAADVYLVMEQVSGPPKG